MSFMTGLNAFVDSNILVYLAANEQEKKETIISLLNSDCMISTQVISENINACIKKLKMPRTEAYAFAAYLLSSFPVSSIHPETIR